MFENHLKALIFQHYQRKKKLKFVADKIQHSSKRRHFCEVFKPCVITGLLLILFLEICKMDRKFCHGFDREILWNLSGMSKRRCQLLLPFSHNKIFFFFLLSGPRMSRFYGNDCQGQTIILYLDLLPYWIPMYTRWLSCSLLVFFCR